MLSRVFSQRGKVPLIVGLPPPRATPRRRTGAAASAAAAAQAPRLPILNLSAGFAVWDTRPGRVLTRPDLIRGQCCGAISEKSLRGQCCGAISEMSQGSPRPRRVLHDDDFLLRPTPLPLGLELGGRELPRGGDSELLHEGPDLGNHGACCVSCGVP